MADEYVSLAKIRSGIYWDTVIKEMPKYVYSKYYGALTMTPFALSLLSIILMPFLLLIKDR